MKMRSILAGVAALAVSAISIAAIPASAAATVYPDSITVMVAGGWGAYSGTWTEANADNSITITPFGSLELEMLGGEADNYFEVDSRGRFVFNLHYRYKDTIAGESAWIEMTESCVQRR